MYRVSITFPGRGRYRGGQYYHSENFKEEKKARDYYTDMLIRYPNNEVKLEHKK